ncbi:MAG: nucleotidyltransferase family protein [Candidatus Omnitrophota bacterium]
MGLVKMESNIDKIKEKILPILEDYKAKRVALFGSAARGQMHKDSDLDILVEISADISLLEFVGLKQKIEATLGRKVDLVEYDTLKPVIREKILKEQVRLL